MAMFDKFIPFISALNLILWLRRLGLLAQHWLPRVQFQFSEGDRKKPIKVQRSRFWKALLRIIRIFCGYDFTPISNFKKVFHGTPPNLQRV